MRVLHFRIRLRFGFFREIYVKIWFCFSIKCTEKEKKKEKKKRTKDFHVFLFSFFDVGGSGFGRVVVGTIGDEGFWGGGRLRWERSFFGEEKC